MKETGIGLNSEYYLLSSAANFKIKKFQIASDDLKKFRNTVDKQKNLSVEEVNYLHCYADRILQKLAETEGENQNPTYLGRFHLIDESKIDSSLLYNFPL